MTKEEKLKEQIADCQAMIDLIKAKLDEYVPDGGDYVPDGGDYGYDEDNDPCMALKDANDDIVDVEERAIYSPEDTGVQCHVKTKVGNIWDDLKRYREDLREFTNGNFHANRYDKLGINIIAIEGLFYTDNHAEEIAHNLLQMVATGRRDANN